MPLTDRAIRNAKPEAKPYELGDTGGLYVEVAPSGGKWWRFKYRFAGKQKRFSLGVYPDVPLASRAVPARHPLQVRLRGRYGQEEDAGILRRAQEVDCG